MSKTTVRLVTRIVHGQPYAFSVATTRQGRRTVCRSVRLVGKNGK